jgi:hypothetical protein
MAVQTNLGLAAWQSIDIAGRRWTSASDYRDSRAARAGPSSTQGGDWLVVALADAPGSAIYFSADTVWFDGVEEVTRRFPIRAAVLFMGAARVPVVGPFALTMTAEDGVQAAHAFFGGDDRAHPV